MMHTIPAMPQQWRDTPENREKWRRLQNSNNYLRAQQARGELVCHYCNKGPLKIYPWDEPNPDTNIKATADHVVPRARGGSDDWSNLVVCCEPCNSAKGSGDLF